MKQLILTLLALLAAAGLYAQAPQRVMPEDLNTTPSHQARMQAPQMRMPADVGVLKLIPRIPVIMVQFTDFTFTRTPAQVDSLFNAVNYTEQFYYASSTGSIRQYFIDQSMGQYAPDFDIYGPITVPHACCDTFSSYANVRALTIEACQMADSLIDFSQYDADNDGKIDLVYIFYAGFGQNDGAYIADSLVSNKNQLIWPHWSTASSTATFDGKKIRDYECANELDGLWTKTLSDVYPAGIGVAVHEFCHALGLPDLYSTNKSQNNKFKHLGMWDVMDYGPYNNEMFTPPALSAYERWFLGWLTPTLLNSPQDVTLGSLETTNQAYLITADGQPLSGAHASSQPYYLLENRQPDKWDTFVPGDGMLITRINFTGSAWSGNTVNYDSAHQYIDIIEADGIATATKQTWYGKPGDAFPTGDTCYLGITGYPITDITENNGIISFRFMGGGIATGTSDALLGEDAGRKLIRDGQLLIVRGSHAYNLLGQEVY